MTANRDTAAGEWVKHSKVHVLGVIDSNIWRFRFDDTLLALPEALGDAILRDHRAAATLTTLQAWSQQVTDALDGRSLPNHPDETPARIVGITHALALAREALETIRDATWLSVHTKRCASDALAAINDALAPEAGT